jgi:hypothetical protein
MDQGSPVLAGPAWPTQALLSSRERGLEAQFRRKVATIGSGGIAWARANSPPRASTFSGGVFAMIWWMASMGVATRVCRRSGRLV